MRISIVKGLSARISLFRSFSLSTKNCQSKKTSLYDYHVRNGGKMIDFAGWMMPVQYSGLSIIDSHLHTREKVSIFDVSHMLQTTVRGKDAIRFIESMTPADVASLQAGSGTLTIFTTSSGGIFDDLIVSKISDEELFIVSNAGCADQDSALLECRAEELRADGALIDIKHSSNALIAIQGPGMVELLQSVIDFDLSRLYFMMTTEGHVHKIPCRISRCGYTGEDGVEISVAASSAVELVDKLLKNSQLRLAGLGARDSLRLEAGLCLYGNDINQTTTPIEASLAWLIGKRRRVESGFPGANVILSQLKDKPSRRRVGFLSSGPPARAGNRVLDVDGKEIGMLTSGCPSPSLKTNVSMGYISASHAKIGTPVKFEIRKKLVEAKVAKMPFVAANYFVK